jgi:hypothetical protein
LICNSANSQNDTIKIAPNIIYAEVGGVGGYGSINYERVLFNKNLFMFATRLGVGTYRLYDYSRDLNPDFIIPFSLNGYYGNNHKVEIGVGQTLSSIVQADFTNDNSKRETSFHTIFSIGYRYQVNTGGLFFRCTYTPVIEHNRSYKHWAGISIGYSF